MSGSAIEVAEFAIGDADIGGIGVAVGGEKLSIEGFGKEFFYHWHGKNKDREEEVGFWMGLWEQFFIPPLKSGGNSNGFSFW
jgi:hypothetical protein